MISRFSSFIFFIILGTSNMISISNKGPPHADESEVKYVARVGEEVKMKCGIEAHPPPLVMWSREGETIDHSWVRYRTSRKILKIKSAELEDTGIYYCKGINGFGKAEIRIDLIVIDPGEYPQLAEADLPSLAPPVFTSATRDHRKTILRESGDTVSLSCESVGKPSPQISWYKDRELFRSTGSTLVLQNIGSRDAGIYTCTAQNIVGSISTQFNVQILPDESSPEIFFGPRNITVEQGENARLDCRVRSRELPAIKWLRRLTEMKIADMADEIISVGDEKYKLISSSRTIELGVDEYMSQLDLQSVSLDDSGMYVCFVTSLGAGGFSVKSSFIHVIEKTGLLDESASVTVLIISLAVVLLLLAAATIFYCANKRRKELSGAELQKPLGDPKPLEQHPIFRENNMKIVVNKMDDLLNQNTQYLQTAGSPLTNKSAKYIPEKCQEPTYEVPHVLPGNLRLDRGGYYDSREVIRPSYFPRQ